MWLAYMDIALSLGRTGALMSTVNVKYRSSEAQKRLWESGLRVWGPNTVNSNHAVAIDVWLPGGVWEVRVGTDGGRLRTRFPMPRVPTRARWSGYE